MLDPRVYRAAFVPAVLALIVVAFSLREPQRGSTTGLAPDAFIGARAFDGPGTGLRPLAAEFPLRRPGGAADDAIARRMVGVFGAAGLQTTVRRFSANTAVGPAADGGRHRRARGRVQPSHRGPRPPRRAVRAGHRRPVRHGGAGGAGAGLRRAHAAQDARARVDQRRQRRRRRGRRLRARARWPGGRRRGPRRPGLARGHAGRRSCPGPTVAAPPRWRSSARSQRHWGWRPDVVSSRPARRASSHAWPSR